MSRRLRASVVVSALAFSGALVSTTTASAQTAPSEPAPPNTGTMTTAPGEQGPGTSAAQPAPKPAGSDATQPQEAKAAAETAQPAQVLEAHEEEKEPAHAVYVSGDIAFTRVDVGAFKDNTAFDKTDGNGLMFGLGLGYRAGGLRIGARFRVNDTTEYTLWNLMAEVGYGLHLRPIQPVFLFHAGYVFDTSIQRSVIASSLPVGNILTPDVDVKGAVVGVEVLASWWLTKFVRLGPFVGFDVNFLSRERAAVATSVYPSLPETAQHPLYSESGSGIGYTFNAGLRGTFDIGF